MKLYRDPLTPSGLRSGVRVQRISAERSTEFGRIAAEGFDLNEAAIPLLASLVDRPGWYLYMSFAGDTPAGAGAMFICDGAAWLDLGATLTGDGVGRAWC